MIYTRDNPRDADICTPNTHGPKGPLHTVCGLPFQRERRSDGQDFVSRRSGFQIVVNELVGEYKSLVSQSEASQHDSDQFTISDHCAVDQGESLVSDIVYVHSVLN